jgi:acetoacetate decarboxylase
MTKNRWVREPATLQPGTPKSANAFVMPPTPQVEVRYLTDPGVYRAVLPPPLEPAAEPRVHLRVTDIDLQFGDFKHAEKILYFAVEALLDGAPVHYPLTYLLNLESAVSPSRERFGEPKKLAGVEIDREGSHVRASVTRSGITLVEIQGDVTEALPVGGPYETTAIWYKFLPTVDGDGFDYGPKLVRAHDVCETRSLEKVEGKLVLRDSPTDPLADLPVRTLESILWRVFTVQHTVSLGEDVDAEAFRPFAHGRYDVFAAH